MRILAILLVLSALPAICFSQTQIAPSSNDVGITKTVDGQLVKISPTNNITAKSNVRGGGAATAVDVVGGITYGSYNKVGLAKGNSYRIDTATTLLLTEFWLDFSTTQNLTFYVYECPTEFGAYTQIYMKSKSVTGTGSDWYASDPLSVPLVKDMHYILIVSWDGDMSYFYSTGNSELTSFGEHTHAYATGKHPLPPIFSSMSNDQAIYHQRITTGAGIAPLSIDNNKLSASTGGTTTFTLDAGVANANRGYVLLGSVTGTSPGLPLPGGLVTLPINWDLFTNLTIDFANTTIFTNSIGSLDSSGQATAIFNFPAYPSASGLIIHFAYCMRNPFDFASNAVQIDITP